MPEKTLTIVAIGASAGGLQACRGLLAVIPEKSGMAYIFVQHLALGHQSLMVDLLTGNTRMKVLEAADGMLIERDHFYVMPPGVNLAVADGMLQLSPAPKAQGARLPFDFLLASLAGDAGCAAICVILSGTGSDGSVGLSAISRSGGLILAQDPEESAYDGMPRNAIATGLVDHVMALKDMPKAFADFLHKGAQKPARGPGALADDKPVSVADIIDLLRVKTGHNFTGYKPGTLERRVARRMTMLGIASGDKQQYLDILRADSLESENLSKDLLINVTSFFRDSHVFDRLKTEVMPDLIRAHVLDQPLRIWIAGCSSGEEAYSIAILFHEIIAATKSKVKLQLFASDVDEDAISMAREGYYPAAIQADVTADRLARFFTKEEQGYRILPEIRASVVFTVQDVLADPPFSRIDLISCRNLLIYLGMEAQAKVISLFHFALREGGVLLLGKSETTGKTEGRFEAISKMDRIYKHIGRSRPGEMSFSLNSLDLERKLQPSLQQSVSPKRGLADICRQLVLTHFAPATIAIGPNNECLYFMGPIAQYLSVAPGYPTADIFAMAPQHLHTKLRSAIQRCRQQNKRIISPGGEISGDFTTRRFSIHVEQFENNGQILLLICFVDDLEAAPVLRATIEGSVHSERIIELENELAVTRTELNGAISSLETSSEEQKAVYEEAISFNEEYQSTNEELLTSKEELQSLNEELTALNAQLQETLEKQRTTSNDLQNILYSTAVATLFLDDKLNIRFFTPATKTMFNVIPSDIGRPLGDLSSLTVDRSLLTDARLVLEHHVPIEQKIEASSGLWYMRRIVPYLDQDHLVEGVVITFVDVTELRRTSDLLREAKRQAEDANASKSRFLASASHDLRQPLQTLSLLQNLLARRVSDEKAQELLARFDNALGSMSGMLNDLLDINEIEVGNVAAVMSDFSIQAILVKIRDELKLAFESKGLELIIADSTLVVHSDPHLLEQMVRNLMSNALKYTVKGKVLLGCRRRGDVVSIEIWDTGIGIAEAQLKSIFDEYHQINNEARERSKGLGLGLSIVQRLGALLGHQIEVTSRESKGSMFAISVGRVRSDLPSQAKEVLLTFEEDKRPSSAPASILVIEDDREIRDLLQVLLEDNGHEVLTAADGPAAVQIAKGKTKPALVLSDYNLPKGMNGAQAVREIRTATGQEIPAVILTGDISSRTSADLSSKHLIRLNKPVKPREVLAAINHLLSQPRVMSEDAAQDDPIKEYALDEAVIFVVDDDKDLRTALCLTLEAHGLSAQSFASSEAFLQHVPLGQKGCLLVDGYLPGMNGLELLQQLKRSGSTMPAIMITGSSDVQMAVDAMKAGASDFVEKPIAQFDLIRTIELALSRSKDTVTRNVWTADAVKHIASLTARQKQIMEMVLAGHPSKNIAADLNISQRTVENHRASIMSKTGTRSLPALARLALAAEEAV